MFKAIFIATLKEYVRDSAAIFWFIVFPIIFVLIFGWMFSSGGSMVFNIGIISEPGNRLAEEIIAVFQSVSNFNVSVVKGDGQKELTELEKGNRSIVLDISDLSLGNGPVEIPLYYIPGKQTNQVLITVVGQIFNEIERNITGSPRIFKVKAEQVHGKTFTDFDYVLPGILAMSLMQMGLFGSLRFLGLRENKTIRGLGVTPVYRSTILASEISLRLLLAVIQTMIILLLGILVYDLKISTSIFHVLAIVIPGSLTFISIGYMLISFVKTMEGGNGLIQVVQFPMMFLSGIFFPVEMLPDFLLPVLRILPLTYLGDALRMVITGFPGNYSLLTDMLVLLGYLVVSTMVTIRFWRWE